MPGQSGQLDSSWTAQLYTTPHPFTVEPKLRPEGSTRHASQGEDSVVDSSADIAVAEACIQATLITLRFFSAFYGDYRCATVNTFATPHFGPAFSRPCTCLSSLANPASPTITNPKPSVHSTIRGCSTHARAHIQQLPPTLAHALATTTPAPPISIYAHPSSSLLDRRSS